MKNKSGISVILLSLAMLLFLLLTIMDPSASYSGVKRGLIICSEVLIPSLFPFSVCSTFLMRSISFKNVAKNRITSKFGGTECIAVYLFSLLGGYPVGAGLVESLCSSKKIDKLRAQNMLCFCVNSGPAFIILAVGSGVLNSKAAGLVLLLSHMLASLVLFFIFGTKGSCYESASSITVENKEVSELFVISTSDAAAGMISICASVILFSAFNTVLEGIIGNAKYLLLFNEISTSVTMTKNIYLISFLLGFGCFCVWFQVINSIKSFKIDIKKFVFSRFLHGFFSVLLTFSALKVFNIQISVISNNKSFVFSPYISGSAAAVSLFVMLILLIISLYSKNLGRKILKDIV